MSKAANQITAWLIALLGLGFCTMLFLAMMLLAPPGFFTRTLHEGLRQIMIEKINNTVPNR